MEKETPMFHWTVPYVTGHRYYIRWAHGLDFESVQVEIIPHLWSKDDGNVEFVMPFYESRAAMFFDSSTGRKANMTYINTPAEEFVMGMNVVYNLTEARETHFVVNGDDGSGSMTITGKRCIENCQAILPPVPEEPEKPPEEIPTNLWSDPKTWKNLDNRIPLEGEKVIIDPNMHVIYDLGISPLFQSLEVNGLMTFLSGQPAKINAYAVWVRAGTMRIGTETEPFDSTVEF